MYDVSDHDPRYSAAISSSASTSIAFARPGMMNSTTPSAAAESWPKSISCGPLTIRIYHHSIPASGSEVDCWTYISSGLSELNHPELVITLRRRPDEAEHVFSREPLEWFGMVYSWVKAGRVIDAFHTHQVQSLHWLGSKDLVTITHGSPIAMPGLYRTDFPEHWIQGIALTQEETEVAREFGFTRLMGHFGLSQKWFPYVPWIDRDRHDCVTRDQMEGTIKSQFHLEDIRGVSIRWEVDRLVLNIPTGKEGEVKMAVENFKLDGVNGFESCLYSDADSCCYWEAGQTVNRLYGKDSATANRTCTGFTFVVMIGGSDFDRWEIVEDGCAVLFRDESWLPVRRSLLSGADSKTIVGDITFCLEFGCNSPSRHD